jgi:hypothetical protein
MSGVADYLTQTQGDAAPRSRAISLVGIALILAGLAGATLEIIYLAHQWSVTSNVRASTAQTLEYSIASTRGSWGLLTHAIFFLTLCAIPFGLGLGMVSEEAAAQQYTWLAGLGIWLLSGFIAMGVYAGLPQDAYSNVQRQIENQWVHQYYGGSGLKIPHGVAGSVRTSAAAPSAFSLTDRAGKEHWFYREPDSSTLRIEGEGGKVRITEVSPAEGKRLAAHMRLTPFG